MQNRSYKSFDDISLSDWNKCTSGLIQYVRINANDEDKFDENDIKVWDSIYDDYLKMFGLQPIYEQYLRKSIELANVQADYIITSDKYLKNVIRILETDIEKLKGKFSKGTNTENVLVYLGKWYGQILDSRKITAKFYFSLLKEYERAN
jgi:hypothetical protein